MKIKLNIFSVFPNDGIIVGCNEAGTKFSALIRFTNKAKTQRLVEFASNEFNSEKKAINALIDNLYSEEGYRTICNAYNQ